MTEENKTNNSVTETVSIEDKLFTINYDHSHETHITCIGDPKDWEVLNPLQWACPARVYTKNQDTGNLDIDFENCIECGTCQILCPDHILWVYPKGGHGIRNRCG